MMVTAGKLQVNNVVAAGRPMPHAPTQTRLEAQPQPVIRPAWITWVGT